MVSLDYVGYSCTDVTTTRKAGHAESETGGIDPDYVNACWPGSVGSAKFHSFSAPCTPCSFAL